MNLFFEKFNFFTLFGIQVGKSVGKLCNKLIIRLYVTPWGSTKGVQK